MKASEWKKIYLDRRSKEKKERIEEMPGCIWIDMHTNRNGFYSCTLPVGNIDHYCKHEMSKCKYYLHKDTEVNEKGEPIDKPKPPTKPIGVWDKGRIWNN